MILFSQGVLYFQSSFFLIEIYMWFFYDDESKRWRHELPTSGNFQIIETHANEQFVDYLL